MYPALFLKYCISTVVILLAKNNRNTLVILKYLHFSLHLWANPCSYVLEILFVIILKLYAAWFVIIMNVYLFWIYGIALIRAELNAYIKPFKTCGYITYTKRGLVFPAIIKQQQFFSIKHLLIDFFLIVRTYKKSLTKSACDSLFKRSVEYYVTYVLKCLIFRDIIYREVG